MGLYSSILVCSLSNNTQGTIPVIFFPGSLCYYLWATCHLFISVPVLCSHLNNCAKHDSAGSVRLACKSVQIRRGTCNVRCGDDDARVICVSD